MAMRYVTGSESQDTCEYKDVNIEVSSHIDTYVGGGRRNLFLSLLQAAAVCNCLV